MKYTKQRTFHVATLENTSNMHDLPINEYILGKLLSNAIFGEPSEFLAIVSAAAGYAENRYSIQI